MKIENEERVREKDDRKEDEGRVREKDDRKEDEVSMFCNTCVIETYIHGSRRCLEK